MNLVESPLKAGSEILIDVVEILNNPHLVAVTSEERCNLFVVHGTVDGTLGDLETVDVHDGNDSAGFGGVEVLVAVPCAMDRDE